MSNTLRLLMPQWQGGENPNYYFGAEILSFIAPNSTSSNTVRIEVNEDFETPLTVNDGVAGKDDILSQMIETENILKLRKPDKIITFGGDCSISQEPFDYLSGKYGDDLGILWLDAHPDVSNTDDTIRDHEMVLANILGHGAPTFVKQMKHPVSTNRVMFGGLIIDELRNMDRAVHSLNISAASPEELKQNSKPIIEWIKQNKVTKLAIHWDLDVISPDDFRSTFPAKPYQDRNMFPAAIGQMTIEQVIRVLKDITPYAEIVGLSLAEHMPWDAINLRNAFEQVSIFNS